MNRIILMGRITADPMPRTTPGGSHVLNFSIAVQRKYTQEGQSQADFFNCVAWERTAEFISRYFAKGSMIAVEGRLQTRTWEDNGHKRYATEVVIDSAYFTGSKNENAPQHQTTPATENDFVELGTVQEGDENDLPF